jgi:hypothetical protein
MPGPRGPSWAPKRTTRSLAGARQPGQAIERGVIVCSRDPSADSRAVAPLGGPVLAAVAFVHLDQHGVVDVWAGRAFDGLSVDLVAVRCELHAAEHQPVGQVTDQCASRENRFFLRDAERAATFPTPRRLAGERRKSEADRPEPREPALPRGTPRWRTAGGSLAHLN